MLVTDIGANSNVFDIVKSWKIGQSAVKTPIQESYLNRKDVIFGDSNYWFR